MEPEEIDKIFKNRLSGLPATPSPDAWLRLQQKMEPAPKQRTMWVYYAAASIILLLVSGLFVLRHVNQTNTWQVAQTKTQVPSGRNNKINSSSQATAPPARTSTQETIAQSTKGSQIDKPVIPEKKEFKSANKPATTQRLIATVAKAKTGKTIMEKKVSLPTIKPAEDATPALAGTKMPGLPAADPKNTFTQNNTSSATANVVQVVVKLDDNSGQATENEEETPLRESLSRKGNLLKNIYLQARNLKNGEPVELAALGVDTEKINTEKENIKQKLNKVISL